MPHPRLLAAATLSTLAGCTAGPDYTPPAQDAPAGWAGLSAVPDDIPSTPTPGAPAIDAWWEAFGDHTLTDLIRRAHTANLDLAQAQAVIRQARAARTIAESGLSPQVDASASATRSRSRGGTGNSFRAGFDASWELDLFGGVRRGVEAADADLTAAALDREDLRVSIAAEIAAAYLDLRGAQRQLAIAQENLELQKQTLTLTEDRFAAGFVSGLDVANARTQVAGTQSQLPAYDAVIRADAFALAVLLGEAPGALDADLAAPLAIPAPPPAIPVGLPSDLLQRRPDIRRAEADLHAAVARIGVAVADQYPRIALNASAGIQGGSVESLSTAANRFWSIGPSISIPIFTAGAREAAVEQRRAAADRALLAYKSSILAAFRDAETALVSFTREQQRRAALEDSAKSAKDALDLALALYDAGRTDFLNVLSAQRELLGAQASLAQSTTTVSTSLVSLYKSLGGGWSPESFSAAPSPP